MVGFEFWQGDELAFMKLLTTDAGYVTEVHLRREAFTIKSPKPPQDVPIRITLWTDDSIFDLPQGHSAIDSFFGSGRGLPNGEYFNGDLQVTDEATNYLVDKRLTPSGGDKVEISVATIDHDPLSQQRNMLSVTVWIDRNGDNVFQSGEYDYLELLFS